MQDVNGDLHGLAIGATIYSGSQVVERGGTASGTTILGGTQLVFGLASGTTIYAGGTEIVNEYDISPSATAIGTTIHTGGLEIVNAGGTDLGASISGGTQYDYGSASGDTIYGGFQVVEAGGIMLAVLKL